MGDPHNPARYGETWPQHKIDYYLREMTRIRPYAIISGGWAWHFLSPPHTEYKHLHDHKDLDIHVPGREVHSAISRLLAGGFKRVNTRFDGKPSAEEFRRYEAEAVAHPPFRVTVDFFVKDVPYREIDGWKIVEPETLLSMYGNIHDSGYCIAVRAARALMARKIDPQGRPELIELPPRR